MKLTGIATFGFGVIIPMSLATRDNDNEPIKCDPLSSFECSHAATLTTTTPGEHAVVGQQLPQQPQLQSRLQHPGSVSSLRSHDGFNSPTRIPSTVNVTGLDKAMMDQQQTPQQANYAANGTQQPQLIFTEQLFAQVVQKAELGRVMMDIENI